LSRASARKLKLELYAPGANIDHRLGSRSVMELTLTVSVKD